MIVTTQVPIIWPFVLEGMVALGIATPDRLPQSLEGKYSLLFEG